MVVYPGSTYKITLTAQWYKQRSSRFIDLNGLVGLALILYYFTSIVNLDGKDGREKKRPKLEKQMGQKL